MTEGRRGKLRKNVPAGGPTRPPEFTSDGRGAAGFVLEHHRQPSFVVPPLSSAVYGVSVALTGPFGVEVTRGGRSRRYRLRRGDVCVFPQGFSVEGAAVEACEFLLLCLHPRAFERAAAGLLSAGGPEIAPRIGAADPLAARMLGDLLRELKTGAGGGPYVDALVGALCAHLVRHYSAPTQAGRGRDGGVPGYVLSGAFEFINDSLDRDLTLAEIASAAGLSPSRFARAFKAETGKAVREYVDELRVEKAKPLLAGGGLTHEEVARRVGFGSARRFAAVFRKVTGASPKSYGKERRS